LLHSRAYFSAPLRRLSQPLPLFLLAGVGPVSLSDIELAHACLKASRSTQACVVGFNVKATGPVEAAAHSKGVNIHQHRVIYHLLEDVGTLMVNLAPGTKESRAAGQVGGAVWR
jgi:translation initiation factor IF-2